MKLFKNIPTLEEISEQAEKVTTMEEGNKIRLDSIFANAKMIYEHVNEILNNEVVEDHPPQWIWTTQKSIEALLMCWDDGDREDFLIMLTSIMAPLMKLIWEAEQEIEQNGAIEQMLRKITENDNPDITDFMHDEEPN